MTLASTPDAELVTAGAQVKLPALNYPMGFQAFLIVGPVVLIGIIIYLHIFEEQHQKLEMPWEDRQPMLPNFKGFVAGLTVSVIFYWMVPVTLAVFAWKGWWQPCGQFLLGITFAVALLSVFLQMRRSPPAWRAWTFPLLVVVYGLFVAGTYEAVANRHLNLFDANLKGQDLRAANLGRADLREADLTAANLSSVDLKRAKLSNANLQGASLVGAHLQGASLDKANLQGASLNNASLQGASLYKAELQGAKLDEAKLQGALLNAAELLGASLNYASLQGASLIGANLQGAFLDGANLQGASLDYVSLQGASLDHASLQGASLVKANIWGANGTPDVVNPLHIWVKSLSVQAPSIEELDQMAKVAEGIESKDAKQIVIGVLDQLKRLTNNAQHSSPPFEDDWKKASNKTRKQEYQKYLADRLNKLACNAEGAPFVAQGLIAYRLESGRLPGLAEKLLAAVEGSATGCPGVKGLDAASKDALRNLENGKAHQRGQR